MKVSRICHVCFKCSSQAPDQRLHPKFSLSIFPWPVLRREDSQMSRVPVTYSRIDPGEVAVAFIRSVRSGTVCSNEPSVDIQFEGEPAGEMMQPLRF